MVASYCKICRRFDPKCGTDAECGVTETTQLRAEIDRLTAERDARPAITPETAAAWKDNDTRAVDAIGRALRELAAKATSLHEHAAKVRS